MLKIDFINLETQDVITASCVCIYVKGDKSCAENNHYGCPADPQHGHYCELGES